MQADVVEALALAVGGIPSVAPILLVILLLSAPQGLAKATGYWFGYAGTYFAVGAALVAAGQVAPEREGSGIGGAVASLVVAAILLVFTWRRWRNPPDDPEVLPLWARKLDAAPVSRVTLFGGFTAVINIKNLAIFLTAVSIFSARPDELGRKAGLLLLVVLVFSSSVALPPLLYLLFSKRADPLLHRIRNLLERYNHPLTLVLAGGFGVFFLVRGVVRLTG